MLNWLSAAPNPSHMELGGTTGFASTIDYRLNTLQQLGVLHGRWLDFGCAAGAYVEQLAARGVIQPVGVDIQFTLLREAARRPNSPVRYACGAAEALPIASNSFDGVLLNEVLEHVLDERQSLNEIFRVLRPNGYLALMSPNRWFPFEGHGMRLGSWSMPYPVPLLPWLPRSIGWRVMLARNYWPRELRDLVASAGFQVRHSSTILPAFDVYSRHLGLPELSGGLFEAYQRSISQLDKLPVLRHLGVSTLILAQKPAV